MAEYADKLYQCGEYQEYTAARCLKESHFRNRLREFGHYFTKGRLLDIGCSCGFFLNIAVEHGFDAYGVELSRTAISAADPRVRNRILWGRVSDLHSQECEGFDLVTAFDIIEHTENPIEFLREVRSLLKPGGGLVISTPDTGHILRYLLGKRWPMLQPMQHTVLFSKKSLRNLLYEAGFIQIVITNAHKTFSIDYLFDQIRGYNPNIYKVYGLLKSYVPRKVRSFLFTINIGEMLAVGVRSE